MYHKKDGNLCEIKVSYKQHKFTISINQSCVNCKKLFSFKKISPLKTDEGEIQSSSSIGKKGFSGLINSNSPPKPLNTTMIC